MLDFDEMMERVISARVPDLGIHPTWHAYAPVDLRERVMTRVKQRAYLARYGRQDFFDLSHSVVEIDAAVREIGEVVGRENDASRVSEDHG